MKLCHAVSLGLGLKEVKIIARNVAKFGVHACLSNGHPNLWSSFNSWKLSKAKHHRAVLLGFGLKESKITLSIMKVRMRSYLPNAHLNLWSNFNFEKLVKSETLSCGFAKIGVTGGENSSKRRESWSARLSIKWASKSMIKFQSKKLVRSETLSFIYARVGLEGVQIA